MAGTRAGQLCSSEVQDQQYIQTPNSQPKTRTNSRKTDRHRGHCLGCSASTLGVQLMQQTRWPQGIQHSCAGSVIQKQHVVDEGGGATGIDAFGWAWPSASPEVLLTKAMGACSNGCDSPRKDAGASATGEVGSQPGSAGGAEGCGQLLTQWGCNAPHAVRGRAELLGLLRHVAAKQSRKAVRKGRVDKVAKPGVA